MTPLISIRPVDITLCKPVGGFSGGNETASWIVNGAPAPVIVSTSETVPLIVSFVGLRLRIELPDAGAARLANVTGPLIVRLFVLAESNTSRSPFIWTGALMMFVEPATPPLVTIAWPQPNAQMSGLGSAGDVSLDS